MLHASTKLQRLGWLPQRLELLAILVIVVLCGLGIRYVLLEKKSRESARLHAIVDLQTRHVADWLRERQADAEMVRLSSSLSAESQRWHNQSDGDIAKRMQAQFAPLRIKGNFWAMDLHDHAGQRIWTTSESVQPLAPELLQALQTANIKRHVQRVGPYLDSGGHIHLDYVVALAANADAAPLLVLHADIEDWLCPTLGIWPNLSDSGESFLFRRDGEQVLYLCPLRHQPNAALRLRLPISSADLLAAQVLRGEVLTTETIHGVDYRGTPVLGVAQAIAGTDWLLIAKLDVAEIWLMVVPEIVLIVLIGSCLLIAVLAGSRLLHHRQHLALATAIHATRAESEARLREAQRIGGLGHREWDIRTDRHIWSEEIYQIYGRDPALPPARYPEVADYFTQESWADLMRYVTEARTAGTAYQCDAKVRRSDGSQRWITARGEAVHDADGHITLLRGTVQDITARKQAEQKLHASRQRFQDIVDASADWVWEVDAHGRYSYASEGVQAVLGYTPADLLGRSAFEFMPPEEATRVTAAFRDIVAQRVSFRDLENINQHRDGRLLYIHTTGVPILDADGALLGYRGLDRLEFRRD